MSARSAFEQPSKWNYLVDDSIPLTWDYRRRLFRFILPFLTVSAVFLTESILIRAWLDDRLTAQRWLHALASPVMISVMLLVLLELVLRMQHRTRRRLTLSARTARFSHSKYPVYWKYVIECRFEPVAGHPELTRFSLTFRLDRKGCLRRTWAMILSSAEMTNRLRSELAARTAGNFSFAVICANQAQLQVVRPYSKPNGLWLASAAIFLFYHGSGLLGASLAGRDTQPTRYAQGQTSESKERFRRFARNLLKSEENFRTFVGITGATLTGASIFLFVLSNRQRRILS